MTVIVLPIGRSWYRRIRALSRKDLAVLAAPVAVNVSMQVAFRVLPQRVGRERGYLVAFAVY